MAAVHPVHGRQVRIARRAHLAAIRFVGAVGDQIDAELALGRLDIGVDLAGRRAEALGIELEVVDHRLHRALHLGAARRRDLVVLDHHRARRLSQQGAALAHDAQGLAHLLHAAEITVVAVAVDPQRDVEFQFVIDLVGLVAAQVPGDARAAQHHAGEAPGEGLLAGDDADIDVALLEDAVVGDQAAHVLEPARIGLAPSLDVVDQRRGQVLVDAAGAEIVGVQPGPAGALVEDHQLFAFFEAPGRQGPGADVHGLGGDVQDVVEDAADLAIEHPDDRAPARDLDVQQLLDGQAEGVLLVHRADIVEPVEIRDVLEVGPGLHQLFGAAVQQADVRVDPLDHLAVQLQHHAQHAVRGRMLRAEVERELARAVGGHRLRHFRDGMGVVGHHLASAFSSPGSTYSAPSQGERKSKARNWVIFTGS